MIKSDDIRVYLRVLASCIYVAECFSLGLGVLSIVNRFAISLAMDIWYLLDLLKIFALTGYIFMQCCFRPTAKHRTSNRIIWFFIILTSAILIGASIFVCIEEVVDIFGDITQENDTRAYVAIAGCLIQISLFAIYTIMLIRYFYYVEYEYILTDSMLKKTPDGDKEYTSILNKMTI